MASTPHGQLFASNRPVVMGRRGMVSSGHPLASQAGVSTLQRGGNAVDAALAVAAAVSVVEPLMSGIGGDGFIMVYTRADDALQVINATGSAPYAATLERYQATGIPMKGVLSTSVPSLLRGWTAMHNRYGTLSLSDILAPAIDLAANGFPVSHLLAKNIAEDPMICEFPTSAAVYARSGRPVRAGELLYQEDLARTFERIATEGEGVFYEGEIGEAIVRFIEEQGGLITMRDLADQHVRWSDAISTTYRGHRVYEAPPNSSGHVLLQELSLAERFDLRTLGCNTPESIHVMVEAKRLAFADREAYMADPEWVEVPSPGCCPRSTPPSAPSSSTRSALRRALPPATRGAIRARSRRGQPPASPRRKRTPHASASSTSGATPCPCSRASKRPSAPASSRATPACC